MPSLIVLNNCMFSDKQKAYLRTKFYAAEFYDDTSDEETAIRRIGDKNIIVMDQFVWTITENLLKQCPNLQLIILNTTAYDSIPTDLLKRYKVKLVNLKNYAADDVAELALSMMLSLNCNFDLAEKIAKNDKLVLGSYSQTKNVEDIWPGHPLFSHLTRHQMHKLTIGIVGLGNIGQAIARLFQKLDMRTIAYNRSIKNVKGVEMVSLIDLFTHSDVIIICLKYDPRNTKKIISNDLLQLAKDGSIFISLAPLELIDTDCLVSIQERFRGIGLDFVSPDLVKRLTVNNIITPHLGHQSYEAYKKMTDSIIESAVSFAENRPIHLVEL